MRRWWTPSARSGRPPGALLALCTFGALLAGDAAGQEREHSEPRAKSASAASPLPRLLLATYFYHYQEDPRKPLPTAGIRKPDGSTALSLHPWEGVGPWLSYDRVQWHRDQLLGLRLAGIDVILPVYSGSTEGRPYALKGLDCLVQAIKELTQERIVGEEQHPPAIGLQLDTAAMRRQYGAPPDLKSEDVQRTLYGMIREFFLHVPPEFRAVVPRPSDPSRRGVIVLLKDASSFKDLDATFAVAISRRFEQEFGVGILWLATEDFRPRAPGLDGYLPATSTLAPGSGVGDRRSAISDPGSPIRLALVRPGSDTTALLGSAGTQPLGPVARPGALIESRGNGHTYIQSWLSALRSGPDWVLVDSWNGFSDGTAVGPTLQFGIQYTDLTRAGAEQLHGTRNLAAHIRWATPPAQMAPQTLYQVEALVANVGRQAWGAPVRAGLSYRWFRDGRPVGDPGPVVLAGPIATGAARRMSLGVTSPVENGRPLPDGDYELRLDMVRTAPDEAAQKQPARDAKAATTRRPSKRDRKPVLPEVGASKLAWFEDEGDVAYRVPVRIGPPDAVRPSWLSSGMASMVKSGAVYTIPVRVRNDGAAPWRREEGAAIGYRWRRVSVSLRGGAEDRDEVVAPEGGRTPLPVDLPPGVAITVPVTVRVAGEGDRPLPVWDAKQNWVYQLEWDLYSGKEWASAAGGRTRREVVQVLPDDPGPRFLGSGLPNEMKAGSTVTAKFGIRNTGPEPWSASRSRIVYHWFHFDGTEAVWSAEGPPLQADVPPGQSVVVELAVRVPDTPGPMYLVLDLKQGDALASTTLNTRSGDLLVHPVIVTEGTLIPVDLTKSFDIDGISLDDNRTDGDLDGEGRTLPAEALPSYVWRPVSTANPIVNAIYPSGLWVRPLSQGSAPVPFRFPVKRDGEKNALRCAGQRIALPEGRRRAVHCLATATAAHEAGTVTFVYADGSTRNQPLQMSLWNEGPRHGETVAFSTSHRHQKEGDDTSTRVHLYQYALKPDPAKALVAIVLPQSPAMKLFAITLEGAS